MNYKKANMKCLCININTHNTYFSPLLDLIAFHFTFIFPITAIFFVFLYFHVILTCCE